MQVYQHEQRIANAVNEIQKLLETNKVAKLPEDQDHLFADKYTVVESVCSATIYGLINCLKSLGLKSGKFDHLKPTLLKVVLEESCQFIKKEQKKTSQGGVVNEKGSGLFKSTSKSEFFTVSDEYFWDLKTCIQISIENVTKTMIVQESMQQTLKTLADINPRANHSPRREFEVLISDLVTFSNQFEYSGGFQIDKTDKDCITPSRNKETEKFVAFAYRLGDFCKNVMDALNEWFGLDGIRNEIDIVTLVKDCKILIPVVPIMKETLPTTVIQDHVNSIQTKQKSLEQAIVSINTGWAKMALFLNIFANIFDIAQAYFDGVTYIEELLRKQIIQAIGKQVTLKEIQEYMTFHCRNLFQEKCRPQAFVADVRMKGCTPEGTISVFECGGTEALYTTTKAMNGHPVSIRLNASTKVQVEGAHVLHGAITYQFSTEQRVLYELHAKARQFSSFVILIGTMTSHTEFQSKHGMIVQNKDAFMIPLLFEVIPSAAEFRDAIQSLSKEQQDFCKLFRKMQLESSTFAVVVVQIKPQLERVLNLETGALTKEIKLTQDLMRLLLEYQVPTDLLKFDGSEDVVTVKRVNAVRESVKMVMDMIEESKKEEAEERKRVAELARMEQESISLSISSGEGMAMSSPQSSPGFATLKKMAMPSRARMGAAPLMAMMSAPQFSAPPPPPAPAPVARQEEARQPVANQVETGHPTPPSDPQNQPPTYNESLDYTKVSTAIDHYMDTHLKESTIRPVIIKQEGAVSHSFTKSLLSKPDSTRLYDTEKKNQHEKALELLDCLSRSGELPMLDSQVHIVYAVQQSFDDSVMDTLVMRNVNPIKSLEKAMVLLSKVVHSSGLDELIVPAQVEEMKLKLPDLE